MLLSFSLSCILQWRSDDLFGHKLKWRIKILSKVSLGTCFIAPIARDSKQSSFGFLTMYSSNSYFTIKIKNAQRLVDNSPRTYKYYW